MQILRELGELFLESVPTIIIFLLFYWFLRSSFFRPFERAIAERSARIEKARAEAQAIQAAAKGKEHSYQEALKKARAGVFAEQEIARRAALEERARILQAARGVSQEFVRKEKERVAWEFDSARAELEVQSADLGSRIAQLILERPTSPREGAR